MSHRVLIVEDERNYRQVLAMMLMDLDLEILEAEDGLAVLELLEQTEIDLIISDIQEHDNEDVGGRAGSGGELANLMERAVILGEGVQRPFATA